MQEPDLDKRSQDPFDPIRGRKLRGIRYTPLRMEIPGRDTPQIEGYDILEPIGRGGMGVVFRARQTSTGRQVALKFLKEPEPGSRARFMREIQVCLKLSHPGIIEVLDCGERGSLVYFSMELIEGKTLHEQLASQGKFARDEILTVASQAFAALEYCHRSGVLHRDVKPNNIMRDRHDRVVLMDLGLATGEGMSVLTRTGSLMGTPRYMAPELIVGEKPTTASDLYALGVSLYELAAGKPPFNGTNLMELARAITHQQAIPLAAERPDLPGELCELVDRLLLKNPPVRPGIPEVRKVLEAPTPSVFALAAAPPPAEAPPGEERSSREGRRLRRGEPSGSERGPRRAVLYLAIATLAGGLLLAVMKIILPSATGPISLASAPASPSPSPGMEVGRKLARLIRQLRVADDRADEARETPREQDEIVHKAMVWLGELRGAIQEVRSTGQTGEIWLGIEFTGGRVLRFVQDHGRIQDHLTLRLQLERLAQLITPADPSPTFRRCCELLLLQRLTRLTDDSLRARMNRLETHLEVADIFDTQDRAWKESLRGYSYRVDTLHKVTQLTGSSRFLEREFEKLIDPSRFRATRLRLLDLVETALPLCRPSPAWTSRDLSCAEGILECARELGGRLLADETEDPALVARATTLLERAVALEAEVQKITLPENLSG